MLSNAETINNLLRSRALRITKLKYILIFYKILLIICLLTIAGLSITIFYILQNPHYL